MAGHAAGHALRWDSMRGSVRQPPHHRRHLELSARPWRGRQDDQLSEQVGGLVEGTLQAALIEACLRCGTAGRPQTALEDGGHRIAIPLGGGTARCRARGGVNPLRSPRSSDHRASARRPSTGQGAQHRIPWRPRRRTPSTRMRLLGRRRTWHRELASGLADVIDSGNHKEYSIMDTDVFLTDRFVRSLDGLTAFSALPDAPCCPSSRAGVRSRRHGGHSAGGPRPDRSAGRRRPRPWQPARMIIVPRLGVAVTQHRL